MLEHIHLQKMINTMNRPQNRNHKWLHTKFAIIAILLTLGASTVQADDFMQKESNYSAMVIDKDRIQTSSTGRLPPITISTAAMRVETCSSRHSRQAPSNWQAKPREAPSRLPTTAGKSVTMWRTATVAGTTSRPPSSGQCPTNSAGTH